MAQEELIVGLLRDVHSTQLTQADNLGKLTASVDLLLKAGSSNDSRITALERKGWKQTGFFAAIIAIGEPVVHYIAKKGGF